MAQAPPQIAGPAAQQPGLRRRWPWKRPCEFPLLPPRAVRPKVPPCLLLRHGVLAQHLSQWNRQTAYAAVPLVARLWAW